MIISTDSKKVFAIHGKIQKSICHSWQCYTLTDFFLKKYMIISTDTKKVFAIHGECV